MPKVISNALSEARFQELLKLAKLTVFSEEEALLDKSYLEDTINTATTIDVINTKHLKPATHAFELEQRLRADVVTDSDDYRAIYHQLAPVMVDGFYCVPAVIDDCL